MRSTGQSEARGDVAKLLAVAGCFLLTAVLAAGQPSARAAVSADLKGKQADGPKPTPTVQRTIEPAPTDGPAISVSGVVVTPEGKPVSGATVILRAKLGGQFYAMAINHNRDVLARTKSDAAGRFAFDKVLIPPRLDEAITRLIRGNGGVELLAWADGRGMIWTEVRGLTQKEPVRLVLPVEAKVTGVVRDKAGRGVPDVRVSVIAATRSTTEVDNFYRRPGDLNLIFSEVVTQKATTDGEGRFTLPHLPPDLRLQLHFARPGLSAKGVFLDTDVRNKFTEIRTSGGGGGARAVQRSPLEVVAEPHRFVRIKVVDHAGQAVGDGGVQMLDSERRSAGQGEVNKDGEARIAIWKPGRLQISYSADPLQPRLSKQMTADLKPGDDTPVIEMRLPEARWLKGRVVDADTGKGIVGAYVRYSKKKDPAVEDSAAFSTSVSGPDGEFRIPVAAGPGSLSTARPIFGYYSAPKVALDVPPTGDPGAVTVSLVRGLAVRGVIRDRDGKPVAGAVVHVLNEGRPFRETAAVSNAEGRYLVSGLSPLASVILLVSTPGDVARANIDADPKHPEDKTRWKDLDLRLEQGVALTGRVLFKEKPRAGVVMKLHRSLGERKNSYYALGEATTDAEGRYRFEGLEAGDRYDFEIWDADGLADPDWQHQRPHVQTVRKGPGEIELPDVHLGTRSQTLRGTVVDPKGKPLAGIRVSARLAGRAFSIPRPVSGSPPWTQTDDKGRFELVQLPDKPIQLMAYRSNPKGGRIEHPSITRPTLNQQDIRIVFDPTLNQPIEDLDAPKRPIEKKK